MAAQLSNKLEQIQTRIKEEREMLYGLNQLLKKQASRILKLQNLLKFDKAGEQSFQSLFGNSNAAVYQDYCKLIAKQICGKISDTIKDIDQLKNSLSKIATQIKSNKNENAKQSLEAIFKKFEGICQKFYAFWHTNSYLMTNYRLDIAAKELEKWDKGINVGEKHQQVGKEIDNLFR